MVRRITIRRGSATDWTTFNPTLASGEFGLDVTNRVLKLGNGSSNWNSLAGVKIDEVMSRNVYDTNNNGVVDNSEALGGQNSAWHVSRANHTGTQAISTVSGLQAALDDKIPLSQKGANNGVATLDAGGKIPVAQLPTSVMEFKGTWNAATNTPTLADGTGNTGDVYLVSVGGTRNLGSGNITFEAGDWVVYNGTIWQRSINSNSVVSVNGQTGAVVLTTTNINEGTNLYFTQARVLGALLTGYSVGSDTALAAGDTVLQAFNKIQGQINARMPLSYLDTSNTLGGAGASDVKVPSQKAVRDYFLNETAEIDGGSPSSIF